MLLGITVSKIRVPDEVIRGLESVKHKKARNCAPIVSKCPPSHFDWLEPPFRYRP